MSVTEASRRVPRPHHNFVPEYQQSGIPHVETRVLPDIELNAAAGNPGTTVTNVDSYKFTFESVTRWITIHNHDDVDKTGVRIYFNRTAAITAYDAAANQDSHYYLCDAEEVLPRLELKCKELYILPATDGKTPLVSVIAGLTNVKSEDFPDQTKANGFLGVED